MNAKDVMLLFVDSDKSVGLILANIAVYASNK